MFFLCSGTTYSTQKTWNWKISPIWLILDDWQLKTYWVHFLTVFDGNMAMRCLILHLTPCPPPTNALCSTSRGWLFGTVGRGVHLVGYARRRNRAAHFIEILAKHFHAFIFIRVACWMIFCLRWPWQRTGIHLVKIAWQCTYMLWWVVWDLIGHYDKVHRV
jgi:hypothetical protein